MDLNLVKIIVVSYQKKNSLAHLRLFEGHCILSTWLLEILIVQFQPINIHDIKVFNNRKIILFDSVELCLDFVDECNIFDLWVGCITTSQISFAVESNIKGSLISSSIIFDNHVTITKSASFQSTNFWYLGLKGRFIRFWILLFPFWKVIVIQDHLK